MSKRPTQGSSFAGQRRIAVYVSGAEPAADVPVYSWNRVDERVGWQSLLNYCEAHAEDLRARYGQWVHDLGLCQIGGRRVIDAMAIDEGWSAWWMTVFVEKSPFKVPAIVDAIRLMALEDIIAAGKPLAMDLYCDRGPVRRSICDLCQRMGIAVNFPSRGRNRAGATPSLLRRAYQQVPLVIRGAITLSRFIWARRRLSAKQYPVNSGAGNGIFVCSYLFNLEPEAATQGRFHSRYWGALHALLAELNLPVTWLQIYYRHPAVPSPAAAERLVYAFNRDALNRHVLVDSFVSLRLLRRVGWRWLRLATFCLRRRGRDAAFRPRGANGSLWWLMREEWFSSWCGPLAVQNLIWIELFEASMAAMPKQRAGFFLCENQGWERAFIHSWRKHGHGRLTAVPHSTRSFWDLRFYHDPRDFTEPFEFPIPRADRIAVNGPAAFAQFKTENYPAGIFCESEALRYGNLRTSKKAVPDEAVAGSRLKILVLGEYSYDSTLSTLRLLAGAAGALPGRFELTLKPHPNAAGRNYHNAGLPLTIVLEPLAGILDRFDAAICGSTTSAAVDAYVAGLKVIVIVDPNALDFSPLRGWPDVSAVSDSRRLLGLLRDLVTNPPQSREPRNFFFVDPKLTRWRALLLNN